MYYPDVRLRRLRSGGPIREMLQETRLDPRQLIYPLFVTEGQGVREAVEAMPGVFRFSVDLLLEEVAAVVDLGILAVLLFGIPAEKDEIASSAYDEEGVVQQAVRAIKERFPSLIVITDVCLCEYMSHGHCGIVRDGEIVNDETLPLLAQTALSHARAGADWVAPSDMMDGRVRAIRDKLDHNGSSRVGIISYASKFASAYYGPFREAAGSAPSFGDRRSYQMNPANRREALHEVQLDMEEGTDMVIVKPALAYMDIISDVRQQVLCPVLAYNVSGEYSMVKAAAQQGWVDERRIVLESLTGMRRAGADLIITYHAKDVAGWLRQG